MVQKLKLFYEQWAIKVVSKHLFGREAWWEIEVKPDEHSHYNGKSMHYFSCYSLFLSLQLNLNRLPSWKVLHYKSFLTKCQVFFHGFDSPRHPNEVDRVPALANCRPIVFVGNMPGINSTLFDVSALTHQRFCMPRAQMQYWKRNYKPVIYSEMRQVMASECI